MEAHFAAVHWQTAKTGELRIVEVVGWSDLRRVLARAALESLPDRDVVVEVGLGADGEIFAVHTSAERVGLLLDALG